MLIQANALHIPLTDNSVQCVVTSPPYLGLRDYGLPPLIWDGQEGCEHECGESPLILVGRSDGGRDIGGRGGNYQGDGPHKSEISQGAFCLHCSAWRGSLGLEPTIDLYLSHLVAIFREIRRVLRKDGTCWVNIGDSYAGSWSGNSMRPDGGTQRPGRPGFQPLDERVPARSGVVPRGLKPKDLCLIPFRLALALQADGWWVRSDIIFSKKNPMPESVTDRPTRSHEYLFLLSKNARYYYDQEAIRELSTSPEQEAHNQRYARVYDISDARSEFRQPGNVNSKGIHARPGPGGRNIRSVWTIPTAPYPGAHFATFPPDLVRPCILAGSAKRGIVLDPFCGSGTVGLVCRELDRHFIGLDLSFPYLRDQAMPRVEWKAPDVKMEGLPLFDNPKER